MVFSATPVPGNERAVNETIDRIHEIGASVVTGRHADRRLGHGWQEELKLMLNLTKPRYVLPVDGDHQRLRLHAGLAESVGIVPRTSSRVATDCRSRSTRAASAGEDIHAGVFYVDGVNVGEPDDVALRDAARSPTTGSSSSSRRSDRTTAASSQIPR